MKKQPIYILFALFAILITSCSKESQIEGLIATKPTVVQINTEVIKGTTKAVPITIDNTTINLQVNNYYVKSGTTETRYCMLTFPVSVGFFSLTGNTSFVVKAETGQQLSSSFFSAAAYSGYLYYTTNAANTTNYNYLSTNGIQYGNSYYIPLKVTFNGNSTTFVYAYLQITVAVDKVTINKLVYNKIGNLTVGEE